MSNKVSPKQNTSWVVVFIIMGVCLASCLIFFIAPKLASKNSPPTPTVSTEVSAWYVCLGFIEKQLGLSPLDAQEYNAAAVVNLPRTGQYNVDVYYAKYTTTYECVVVLFPNGDWKLRNISIK